MPQSMAVHLKIRFCFLGLLGPEFYRKALGTVFLALLFLVSCKSDDTVISAENDTDGDGIYDEQESLNGTNKGNPCDPKQNPDYTGYDSNNPIWMGADCDVDGITNGQELADNTNPYVNEKKDTDGDGVPDFEEVANGTDSNDPCDPLQDEEYQNYNTTNTLWSSSDCDGDGISNGDEVSSNTNPYLDETIFAIPEFLPTLSELRLFKGSLEDLITNGATYEYTLSTPLYSDYAHKLRTISLPQDSQIIYQGEGLLEFPDNTVISKTFYYFIDERNPSLGKKLIETRILIKMNGVWELGNYLWNEEQTEAVLSNDAPTVRVDWIDSQGVGNTVDYKVPFAINCTQCHNVNDVSKPIGPKARNLNTVLNGKNQLQYFIDEGLLVNAPAVSEIAGLPDWSNQSEFSLEERARAYMDINCAHCHQPGGYRTSSEPNRPDFRYETTFENSLIYDFRADIRDRVKTSPDFGASMPLLGVTELHSEGVQLIQEYIDSL
ncbi:hypothetical protein [Pareuzebyella sediminis]|uniref:hypothetical protein n=1 Tax=Pareuzebyella sediminis TaxID=2607998 RepID=UPI0011ED2D2A|nr:hypothetical protein [Pareuzebyella sediminis]